MPPGAGSHTREYAERLVRLQMPRWKQLLGVQTLHRWSLRRLDPGFTLDVGCGIGRNLLHLRNQSVGVDVNDHCVRVARSRGVPAFTPEGLFASEYNRPGRFDSMLVAHVVEHMTEEEAVSVLRPYEPLVRAGGRIILIAPQEAGFRSDSTHIQFMDPAALARIAGRLEFRPERTSSFPLPRAAGSWFTYNEFVLVARK